MIRIDKGDPPSILLDKGKRQRNIHCDEYSRDPDAYQNGDKSFNFTSSIYAHNDVRKALIDSHHRKCCFCESITKGEVEHFRPKGGVKQDRLQRPGYYWLAYEWENLYLACGDCNRSKGPLFPLENPAQRAISHRHDLKEEQPLLIDPGLEEPGAFIDFRGEFAFSVDDSRKGTITIETVKLNNEVLQGRRLTELHRLKILHKLVKLNSNDPQTKILSEEAQENLKLASRASGEFAAAVRAAIKTDFRYVID